MSHDLFLSLGNVGNKLQASHTATTAGNVKVLNLPRSLDSVHGGFIKGLIHY